MDLNKSERDFVVIVETRDGRKLTSLPISESDLNEFIHGIMTSDKQSAFITCGKELHFIPGDMIALITCKEVPADDEADE